MKELRHVFIIGYLLVRLLHYLYSIMHFINPKIYTETPPFLAEVSWGPGHPQLNPTLEDMHLLKSLWARANFVRSMDQNIECILN